MTDENMNDASSENEDDGKDWLRLGVPDDPTELAAWRRTLLDHIYAGKDPSEFLGVGSSMNDAELKEYVNFLKLHCHPDKHKSEGKDMEDKAHKAVEIIDRIQRDRGFVNAKQKVTPVKIRAFTNEEKKSILYAPNILRSFYTLMKDPADKKAVTYIEAYNAQNPPMGPKIWLARFVEQYNKAHQALSIKDEEEIKLVLEDVVENTRKECTKYNYPLNFSWPSADPNRPPGPIQKDEKSSENSASDCPTADEIRMIGIYNPKHGPRPPKSPPVVEDDKTSGVEDRDVEGDISMKEGVDEGVKKDKWDLDITLSYKPGLTASGEVVVAYARRGPKSYRYVVRSDEGSPYKVLTQAQCGGWVMELNLSSLPRIDHYKERILKAKKQRDRNLGCPKKVFAVARVPFDEGQVQNVLPDTYFGVIWPELTDGNEEGVWFTSSTFGGYMGMEYVAKIEMQVVELGVIPDARKPRIEMQKRLLAIEAPQSDPKLYHDLLAVVAPKKRTGTGQPISVTGTGQPISVNNLESMIVQSIEKALPDMMEAVTKRLVGVIEEKMKALMLENGLADEGGDAMDK